MSPRDSGRELAPDEEDLSACAEKNSTGCRGVVGPVPSATLHENSGPCGMSFTKQRYKKDWGVSRGLGANAGVNFYLGGSRAHPCKEQFRFLFVSQSRHGIHARGAARGDIAGSEGDNDQENRDTEKGEGIGGADAEKKSFHQAGQGECGGDTPLRIGCVHQHRHVADL